MWECLLLFGFPSYLILGWSKFGIYSNGFFGFLPLFYGILSVFPPDLEKELDRPENPIALLMIFSLLEISESYKDFSKFRFSFLMVKSLVFSFSIFTLEF